jgi:hypothetical protein
MEIERTIKLLGISKALKYVSGLVYLTGFLLAINEHYGIFIFLSIMSFIFFVIAIVYEWRFILKTLKKETKPLRLKR